MSAVVIWRPEPLTAKLVARAAPARQQWALAARSKCSSKRVAASIAVLGDRARGAALRSRGSSRVAAKPHEIEPEEEGAEARRRLLRLGSGETPRLAGQAVPASHAAAVA